VISSGAALRHGGSGRGLESDVIHRHDFENPLFGLIPVPDHLVHLDERANMLIYPVSDERIQSE
jgi:hypothetical protein